MLPKNKYLLIAIGVALGLWVIPLATGALARAKK